MRTHFTRITLIVITGILFPMAAQAQGMADDIHSLQGVLDQLYRDMIPLSSQLIGVGRGIAAFAALWYIAARVWRHIANAEAIDFYPLLRPFAIGMAIAFFPSVLTLMNAILQPTVTGTAAMVENSNRAIALLLQQKEEAIKNTNMWQTYGDDKYYGDWFRQQYPDANPEDEGFFSMITNAARFSMAQAAYAMKNQIKLWLSEILHVLFQAAALCINTMRTFYLIVLAILGPLVFGLAVFDGFQNTLTVWLARYINVFLWLPVANIFGAIIARIQENMIELDIQQINAYGDTVFSATDTAYIIFLIMGIIGYFTVPSVANYIVHASGGNVLLARASNFFVGGPLSTASAQMNRAGQALAQGSGGSGSMSQGSSTQQAAAASTKPATENQNQYQQNKLSGN